MACILLADVFLMLAACALTSRARVTGEPVEMPPWSPPPLEITCNDDWTSFALGGDSSVDERYLSASSRALCTALACPPPSRVHIVDSPAHMPVVAAYYPLSKQDLLQRKLYGALGPYRDMLRPQTPVLRRVYTAIMSDWENRETFLTIDTTWLPILQRQDGPLGYLLEPYLGLFRSGAWVVNMQSDTLFACRRPSRVSLNASGQLHRLGGPAVEWRDGLSHYFVQGVRLQQQHVMQPYTITVGDVINEANAEVRRILLDLMGLERFLALANAAVLDTDEDSAGMPRRLYRLHVPYEHEPLVYVRVMCPSTGHLHHLRVPPQMTSCAEAVAWTFDLEVAAYHPVAEA